MCSSLFAISQFVKHDGKYVGMMLRSLLAKAVRREGEGQGDNRGDQQGISLIEHSHTFQDIPTSSKVTHNVFCELYSL